MRHGPSNDLQARIQGLFRNLPARDSDEQPMTDYPPGWICEVVAVRLTRYRSSGLPLSDALAMAEHLEACILCVQRLLLLEPPGVGSRG